MQVSSKIKKSFQIINTLVVGILTLHIVSGMRYSLERREITHRVLYYFRAVETYLYILIPLVYVITVRSNSRTLQEMMDAILNTCGLTRQWTPHKIVSTSSTQISYIQQWLS